LQPQSSDDFLYVDEGTKIPLCFSIPIQSDGVWRVVLPASGCEMMAKVRRRVSKVVVTEDSQGFGVVADSWIAVRQGEISPENWWFGDILRESLVF
jgi:hypothetical protein